jgi:hypothetical protein
MPLTSTGVSPSKIGQVSCSSPLPRWASWSKASTSASIAAFSGLTATCFAMELIRFIVCDELSLPAGIRRWQPCPPPSPIGTRCGQWSHPRVMPRACG